MSIASRKFNKGAVVMAPGGLSMRVEQYVGTGASTRVRCMWSVAGLIQRDDFIEETLVEDEPDFEIVSVGFPADIK